MEVLTEEESRLLMKSIQSPFIRQSISPKGTSIISGTTQRALLIHKAGEGYKLAHEEEIPQRRNDDEILIKVVAIGLNPVDWKGPIYNFGLPSLPWINGRDLAGVVVEASNNHGRIKVGDVVLSPSTDYRDIRKAAFQEYVISTKYNAARVPRNLPIGTSAAVGVAFVTAALGLGICLGVKFDTPQNAPRGPDLFRIARQVDKEVFAEDIRDECINGIEQHERAKEDDWIAIWGASSATGLLAFQLAKAAKLRTICIVDVAKYGERLLEAGADLLVDRLDTERAVSIIRGVTKGRLRFALDTVGKDTAEILQQALCGAEGTEKCHLVGLAGLSKVKAAHTVHHQVPIKAFHDVPQIGEALMVWLEQLLLGEMLTVPQVETAHGGLEAVNEALDLLKGGSVAGKRIVVPIQNDTSITV